MRKLFQRISRILRRDTMQRYVVTVQWGRKVIVHKAKSIKDAREWCDCYPEGARFTIEAV